APASPAPCPAPTESIMTNARVTGLRSVELGVPDLERSAAFYQDVWGLQEVACDGDAIHLRGTSAEHHVVTLRLRPKAALLGVHFAATNRDAVVALQAKAKAFGASGVTAAEELPRTARGGHGFRFTPPARLPLATPA